jgi:hypothetical protein
VCATLIDRIGAETATMTLSAAGGEITLEGPATNLGLPSMVEKVLAESRVYTTSTIAPSEC